MSVTVLDLIRSTAGTDCGALPLSLCTILRPHLLARVGMDDLSATIGTACLMAVPYIVSKDVADPTRNVSLYAVPRDYHLYFKELEKKLIPALQSSFPTYRFALFADHSPIAEVEAAARAGLGVMGCNDLLLTHKWGSFVFLGAVITDAPWPVVTGAGEDTVPTDPPKRCMACGKCLRACPGKCKSGRRDGCLSALTQKKGELSPEEELILAAHPLVWGCDDCQTVCPHNRAILMRGEDTPIDFFRKERLVCLDSATVQAMTDAEFSMRAYAWRGKAVILRNLEIKERMKETT